VRDVGVFDVVFGPVIVARTCCMCVSVSCVLTQTRVCVITCVCVCVCVLTFVGGCSYMCVWVCLYGSRATECLPSGARCNLFANP
jgi:hypothetical protein